MFQLKKAIFLPSFPLLVTILSPMTCAKVVNFACSRMGNAHSLAVGNAINEWWQKMIRGGHMSNKLSTEEKVCPWSTSYLPIASVSSLLSVICVLPSSLLLQANCPLFHFLLQGTKTRQRNFCVFLSNFQLIPSLSVYWSFWPRMQKQFASGIYVGLKSHLPPTPFQ